MNTNPRSTDGENNPESTQKAERFGRYTCRFSSCKNADINIPLELQPETRVDSVETYFTGTPSVNVEECTPSKYFITITQRVKISIGVTVGISAETGESYAELPPDD